MEWYKITVPQAHLGTNGKDKSLDITVFVRARDILHAARSLRKVPGIKRTNYTRIARATPAEIVEFQESLNGKQWYIKEDLRI